MSGWLSACAEWKGHGFPGCFTTTYGYGKRGQTQGIGCTDRLSDSSNTRIFSISLMEMSLLMSVIEFHVCHHVIFTRTGRKNGSNACW